MSEPQDVVRDYFTALARADAGEVAGLFTDDGVVLADGFATAAGADRIRAQFEQTLSRVRIEEQVQIDGVVDGGDVAAVHSRSSGTITRLESGDTSDVAYRELFVLRRDGDGWRIAAYMFNSPGGA